MIREDMGEREEMEERREKRPRRANGKRRRLRKRRRRLSPQVIPVLIAVFLVFVVGGVMVGRMLYEKYSPSKELADTNEYFHLENDQEIAVLLNDLLLEDKGKLNDGRD